MKRLVDLVNAPKTFLMLVNAGKVELNHWTNDENVGGGRILGEACHFVDLMRYLSGSPIEQVTAIQKKNDNQIQDNALINLSFMNGDMGSIQYLPDGAKQFPKERIEVFTEGRTLVLDNYIRLRGFNWPKFKSDRMLRQDKGQRNCVESFLDAIISQKPNPIPYDELIEVAETMLEISQILKGKF